MKRQVITHYLHYALCCSAVLAASVVIPTAATMLPGISLANAYASEQKTTRVPALREKVYSQLARAQKLADEGDVPGGLAALDSIQARSSSMNSYEIAMMHNFYGFIYYNQNDLAQAISAFEKVIAEPAIPESLRLSTTFSLAQLAMANSDYNKVLHFLDQWDAINSSDKPDSYYVLRAQTYYQLKQYSQGLNAINQAIAMSDASGKTPKENWLVLQRAMYYSLNQTDNVVTVLERMVKLYNKAEYWLQLAAMYGETGQEQQQLALLEAAHQQGFLTSKADYRQLAQVYLYNGLAYKAAALMRHAMEDGIVAASAKNYAFIAEALLQAKEETQSIPYLVKAAELTASGQYDQRLAEVYVNTEQFEEAADAARRALDKGGLDFESNAFVALGMAQYNLQNFDASILAFEQAQQHKQSQRLAQQWIQYVKREKIHAETLKTALL
ncbi:tetratricopeptide repeat protein [Pseudoalteromonas sp.]|uniref:tetratricopeptide repeat protein n=1 Tax=Pseudoalteromonas sp. TaxID=53249 RepID=UPI003567D45A